MAYADVAQLVAHNLAKVRVAGSSPVIRSDSPSTEGLFAYLAQVGGAIVEAPGVSIASVVGGSPTHCYGEPHVFE